MKNDRRATILLLAAVALMLCLVLVGVVSCRNGNKNAPKVGICLRQNERDPQYSRLLKDRLTSAGYRVTVADAGNDQSRQNAQIQEFVEKKYALLVIEPVIISTGEQLAGQLMQARMPAVFVNYEPDAEVLQLWERFSYVGCQEAKHGDMQGALILHTEKKGDLNGDGIISSLIITGPEDDRSARLQAESCVQALTDAGETVNTVATLWGEWTEESGRKLCADALAQYGRDVEVIFCGSDAIAQGAAEAIRNSGWKVGTDYYLAGLGGTETGLEMILSDELTGTVAQNRPGQCEKVQQVISQILEGKAVEDKYYVNCMPVSSHNINEFLPE